MCAVTEYKPSQREQFLARARQKGWSFERAYRVWGWLLDRHSVA